jgi:uncharacterized protein YoxC
MEILSFIVAVIALVIAVAAFKRTGGIQELRHQVQGLTSSTDSVRDRTADALNRLEQLVRGKDRPKADEHSEPPTRSDTQ